MRRALTFHVTIRKALIGVARWRCQVPWHLTWGYGWVIVGCSAIATLVGAGVMYSYGIIYLLIASSEITWSPSVISAAGTTQFALNALLSAAAGILCDYIGYPLTMLLACVVGSTGLLLSSFVTSEWMLFATYSSLCGISEALQCVAMYAIICEYFDQKRAIAISIMLASVGIGIILVSQVMVQIAEQTLWRDCFRWLALAYFIALGTYSLLYKPLVTRVDGISALTHFADVSLFYKFKGMIWLCMGSFFAGFALYYAFIFIVQVAEYQGYSTLAVSTLLIYIGAADSISRLLLGCLAEGTFNRRATTLNLSIFLTAIIATLY